jgi:hypothetical protein
VNEINPSDSSLPSKKQEPVNGHLSNQVEAAESTATFPSFDNLPAEIRCQIFGYVVTKDTPVHVYVPFSNSNHGFRLSLCPESSFLITYATCECRDGRVGGNSSFFPTALLVSRRVRREVLDTLFATNVFVFMNFYPLYSFCVAFKTSSAKLQSIRISSALYDDCVDRNNYRELRAMLPGLRNLDLRLRLCTTQLYTSIYEDGFISEIVHFRDPLPESFNCEVCWGHGFGKDWASSDLLRRVEEKLKKIFNGDDPSTIPISQPPPRNVLEGELPLANKTGIIALQD